MSSTKGALGHMLGAAGSIEALIACLTLQHQTTPPNLNLESIEPDMAGLNYVRLQSASGDAAAAAYERPLRAVMSNSFGFGGTNASLIFAQFEP